MTATPRSKVYGDADPAFSYEITAGQLADGDSLTGSLTRAAGQDVGSYRIDQGTLSAGANYAISFVPAALKVTPRPITITAHPKWKVYGEVEPTLTYQVTGSLAYDDKLTGSLDRASGQAVGTYAIGQGDLTAGKNYDLTFSSANLSVSARPITVTAKAQSKVYGEADPALTSEITSGSLAYQDKLIGALDRANGHNVGGYAIRRGTLTAGSNYDLTFEGATLTVTARPITVSADSQEKVYGDADPQLTYKLTSGALQGADAFQGSLSRLTRQKVGSYDIGQGTLTAGDNYEMTFVGAQLNIATRAITVTADSKSKVYGDADPAFTYDITSGQLANGDTLTGAPAREVGEDVGTYTIRRGTLTAGDDYVLTFEPAKLVVDKAPLTLTVDAKFPGVRRRQPAPDRDPGARQERRRSDQQLHRRGRQEKPGRVLRDRGRGHR